MSSNQPTLGQAIDQILSALTPLDETARKTALAAACMQLDLQLGSITARQVSSGSIESPTPAAKLAISPAPQADAPIRTKQVDIRALKEQKKPSSARQMACLVAFYLQDHAPQADRKETVNSGDLEKYFKQAGFKLPAKMPQVLVDAKGAGYFDVASRGEYKLNAVGYNLIAHTLPDGGD